MGGERWAVSGERSRSHRVISTTPLIYLSSINLIFDICCLQKDTLTRYSNAYIWPQIGGDLVKEDEWLECKTITRLVTIVGSGLTNLGLVDTKWIGVATKVKIHLLAVATGFSLVGAACRVIVEFGGAAAKAH